MRLSVAALAAVVFVACARMEPPPGGPPDIAPPRLIETRPADLAVLPGFGGSVEFRFDEVVSEGSTPSTGAGTSELERLILLSPSTRVPEVAWKRSRITVKPAEGWKAGRVYRVQLLPGVTDLRRNRSDSGTVVTFTTGAPAPTTTLSGTVVDWSSRRRAAAALVEALLLPDSLPYRAQSDSSGRFSLGPLPAGAYLVSGILDQNRNGRQDGRESFDSVRLARGKTSAGEIWAFVHDTSAPRASTAEVSDSVSATITISQSLDPRLRFPASAVRLRLLPDSTPVAVASARLKTLDDSLAPRRGPERRDSTARDSTRRGSTRRDSTRRDSTRRDSTRARSDSLRDSTAARVRAGMQDVRTRAREQGGEALTSRPALTDQIVVRPRRPWISGSRYVVDLRDVHTLSGSAGDVRVTLSVPTARSDSSRSGRDSSRTRRDSIRLPTDSVRVPTTPAPRPPPRR